MLGNVSRILCLWLLTIPFLFAWASKSFKHQQIQQARVKAAYKEKVSVIKADLGKHNLTLNDIHIYIRAFKRERLIEVWAKEKTKRRFWLVKTYKICQISGDLGPKRKQGDLQIPEGFYHISGFNPWSRFHLSLRINYPNRSDKILGFKKRLGGDIFIHGNCVTIGCLPITDDKVQELYIYAVEAKKNGQRRIPVTIFPCKLTDSHFQTLQKQHKKKLATLRLWTDLKKAYDVFENERRLPHVTFQPSGRHQIE